jgi:hypothetical protein
LLAVIKLQDRFSADRALAQMVDQALEHIAQTAKGTRLINSGSSNKALKLFMARIAPV